MSLFPDAKLMDFPSLIFMMIVYGYVLMKASQSISTGSEMLLLIYGPGIIGGLLIPILGAIPDSAIILISGLGSGDVKEIQKEISVGVGTLVGSTVMLITIPWAFGVYFGRRDYDPKTGEALVAKHGQPKVSHFSLTNNCVTVMSSIPITAKIMMITSLSYLIIQIPAFFYKKDADGGSAKEAPFALAGLGITLGAFVGYCIYQYLSANREEVTRLQQKSAEREQWKKSLDSKISTDVYQEMLFRKHDKNGNGTIEADELCACLEEMGLKCDRKEIYQMIKELDSKEAGGDNDGKINLAEFKKIWQLETTTNKPKSQQKNLSLENLPGNSEGLNVHDGDGNNTKDNNNIISESKLFNF
jgi:hypothetical protein